MTITYELNAVRIVVPYVGTWIEMKIELTDDQKKKVVPYVGTWIEME